MNASSNHKKIKIPLFNSPLSKGGTQGGFLYPKETEKYKLMLIPMPYLFLFLHFYLTYFFKINGKFYGKKIQINFLKYKFTKT
jgi:hypothetical protein